MGELGQIPSSHRAVFVLVAGCEDEEDLWKFGCHFCCCSFLLSIVSVGYSFLQDIAIDVSVLLCFACRSIEMYRRGVVTII